jgi:surface protein
LNILAFELQEMNQDIIQEILRHLYLFDSIDHIKIKDNQTMVARKLLILLKKWKSLELIKFKKPIVITVSKKIASEIGVHFGSDMEAEADIYYGFFSGIKGLILYIFGHTKKLIMPTYIKNVYSPGEIKDFSHMFYECKKLNKNIGKKWDTSNVTNMTYMFYGCQNLEKNIGQNWETSSVTNMSYMFHGCKVLEKNIGQNWDIQNVTDMSCMFYGCPKIDKNTGANWTMRNVKVFGMFGGCDRLSWDIPKKWDIEQIKSIDYLFRFF